RRPAGGKAHGERIHGKAGVEMARPCSMLADQDACRTVTRHGIGRQVDVFYGTEFLLGRQRKPQLEAACTTSVPRTTGVPRTMGGLEPLHSPSRYDAGRSVGVLVADRSFEQVGYCHDARAGMHF